MQQTNSSSWPVLDFQIQAKKCPGSRKPYYSKTSHLIPWWLKHGIYRCNGSYKHWQKYIIQFPRHQTLLDFEMQSPTIKWSAQVCMGLANFKWVYIVKNLQMGDWQNHCPPSQCIVFAFPSPGVPSSAVFATQLEFSWEISIALMLNGSIKAGWNFKAFTTSKWHLQINFA